MLDALVSFALLASAITANKYVLRFFDPALFVVIRMLAASMLLLVFVAGRALHKKSLSSWLCSMGRAVRASWITFVVAALAITTIPALCKAYALKHMLSSKMATFGCIDPFVTVLLAYALLDERINWLQWLGICCGVVGALVLAVGSTPLEDVLGGMWIFSLPEISMLVAVVVGRFGWIQAQKYLKSHHALSPLEFNGLVMGVGGLFSIVPALWSNLQQGSMCMTVPTFDSMILWIAFAYTVIVGNGIAYTLYATTLKRYSATFISLASLSVPLFVTIFGFILFGEQPTWHVFGALIFFALGLVLFAQATKRKQKTHAADCCLN